MKRSRNPLPSDEFSDSTPPRFAASTAGEESAQNKPGWPWKRIGASAGLAALSAGILQLAYHPFNWSFIPFFALFPWLWGLRKLTPGQAFLVSLVFGTLNSVGAFYFLFPLKQYYGAVAFGFPFQFLYFGAHIGIVGALTVWFGRKSGPWVATFLGALAWGGMEYWKGTGLLAVPIGFLGHGVGEWASFAQTASIGGVPLVSALVFGFNLSLMSAVAAWKAGWGFVDGGLRLGAFVLIIGVGAGWGSMRIGRIEEDMATSTRKLKVAVIQTNIDQPTKFQSYSEPDIEVRRELQRTIAAKLLGQFDEVERNEVDLIITPESAFSNDTFDRDPVLQREVQDRARDLKTPILVGALDIIFESREGVETEIPEEALNEAGDEINKVKYFNALWMFQPEGTEPVRQKADYAKIQLVPFGETIPYLDMIPGAVESIVGIGTFERGRMESPIPLQVGDPDPATGEQPPPVLMGMSVCFEDMIPWLHRGYARNKTDLFVNATNDAWYDPLPGSSIHSHMARWRCIETGIPMVRATNTGLSQVIDGTGAILEQLEPNIATVGRWTITLPASKSVSFYARFGDWFGLLSLIGTIAAFVLFRMRRAPVE